MKLCAPRSALLLALLCSVSCPERCAAQCPTTLSPTVIASQCPNQSQLNTIKSQIAAQVSSMINNTLKACLLPYGATPLRPATSCQQILIAYPTSSSGLYWVKNSTGVAVQIYCRFDTFTNFSFFGVNTSNGYARVASVNFTTDTNSQCPSSLASITVSGHNLCHKTTGGVCDSVTISTFGFSWQTVCGKIAGYEVGTSGAFAGTTVSIDNPYVDGVSITYGYPRNHLWSYGIGAYESNQANGHNCPCARGPNPTAFVGNNWYCESGVPTSTTYKTYTYAVDDVLWDGMTCGGVETSCCLPTVQPWFCQKLSSPVLSNLEMRLCTNDALTVGDVALEQWEFYIQ